MCISATSVPPDATVEMNGHLTGRNDDEAHVWFGEERGEVAVTDETKDGRPPDRVFDTRELHKTKIESPRSMSVGKGMDLT